MGKVGEREGGKKEVEKVEGERGGRRIVFGYVRKKGRGEEVSMRVCE